MAKFGQLVVGQRAGKSAIVMLTSANKKENKVPKDAAKVRVIKNGRTAEELADAGERWATHTGPYMMLAKVLAAEAAKQNP